MTDTIVTGTGMRVTVECDGRVYVLRPITFGEAAELAAAEAAVAPGGAAQITEALRQAIEARGGAEAARHLEVLDQHEAAEIEHAAVILTKPHEQEPPETWTAHRRETQVAHAALMRADAARRRVEALYADSEPLRRARAAATEAARLRATRLLQLALVEWPGGSGRISEAEVAALPEADVVTLFQRAEALRRPGVSEGKA